MSILSTLFSSKPAAPAPAAPAQQTQAPTNQHVANNPTVPNGSNVPTQPVSGEPQNGQSPTENFASLWSTPTQQQGTQAPNFAFDPAQLQQFTSKMDFTQGLNPEVVTKIQAGGPEAVQALMDAMNHVGRQAFSASANLSSNLTERGYQAGTQSVNHNLPNLVTNQLAKNELLQANPALRDPSIAPLAQAIQMQVQQQNPNATPAEINAKVSAYFTHVGKVFNPAAAPAAQGNQGPDNFDFSSFMDASQQPGYQQ